MWIVCSLISFTLLGMAAMALTEGQITTGTGHRSGPRTVTSDGSAAVVAGFVFLALGLAIWDAVTRTTRYKNLLRLAMLMLWLGAVVAYALFK
jgi:hypothetical protein